MTGHNVPIWIVVFLPLTWSTAGQATVCSWKAYGSKVLVSLMTAPKPSVMRERTARIVFIGKKTEKCKMCLDLSILESTSFICLDDASA